VPPSHFKLIFPSQIFRGFQLIPTTQVAQHIDNLPSLINSPQIIPPVRLPYRHVSALFKPMRDRTLIFGIFKPVGKLVISFIDDLFQGHSGGIAELVKNISELTINGRPVSIDNVPKRLGLRWRCFRIKPCEVIPAEESGNMTVTPGVVPFPQSIPVPLFKILWCDTAPRNIMTAILGG